MLENLIMYGAVYDDVHAALADLDSVETLDERKLVGPYDAAVIGVRDGLPHIVKRMDRPTLELIPELVARGRPPIGVVAEPLRAGEWGLAVVGGPELAKAVRRAVRGAVLTAERPLRAAEITRSG